jgi:hypothetical protein
MGSVANTASFFELVTTLATQARAPKNRLPFERAHVDVAPPPKTVGQAAEKNGF